MWSEAENYDLALSFQEKAGCDEIWEKICQVILKIRKSTYSLKVFWGFFFFFAMLSVNAQDFK